MNKMLDKNRRKS